MTPLLRELTVLCLALAPVVATAQELRPERRSEAAWQKRAAEQFEACERSGEQPAPREPPCWPQNPNRVHKARRLTLYQDATDKVLEVYVSEGVATILRLPAQLAKRGTAIAPGGERRFKLLMDGDQILITPTRQLAQGEHFPMVVALADGTIIPLSLTRARPSEGQHPDGEVWLDREKANPEQLRIRLASMTERAKGFEASYRQALKEQESEDFALAELMVAQRDRLTAFDKARRRDLVASAGRRIRVTTYAPRPDAESATSKVVAVFEVTNKEADPLDLSSGQALRSQSGAFEPPALRVQPSVIPPGGEGRIAVVLDRASFGSGETVTLRFSDKRQVVQLSADLSLEDFAPPSRSSSWWPF